MERESDSRHTAPVYRDILNLLEAIFGSLRRPTRWEIDWSYSGAPGKPGWEPFAAEQGVIYWRRPIYD